MDVSGRLNLSDKLTPGSDYDRAKEIQSFDDTKAGVKGLLDAGIKSVPRIFIRPSDELAKDLDFPTIQLQVPVIDLDGFQGGRRKEILEKVLAASESWGFFQLIEPELTLGSSKHSDPCFLTILLQDQIGGLQVLHENQWVNVPPMQGGLVVNIGDFLQVVSNNKLMSVAHRVVANHVGPRISVASFFKGQITKMYGPMKELLSEENPPLYTDFSIREYMSRFLTEELDRKGGIDCLKI
ncbi:hypothetical protein ACFE04_006052 [Oxalis oulophora]